MQPEVANFHLGDKINSLSLPLSLYIMDSLILCVLTKVIGGFFFYFYINDNARSCVLAKCDNSANSTDKFVLRYGMIYFSFSLFICYFFCIYYTL